jgi:GNAT superfamily N-acetyltransferase
MPHPSSRSIEPVTSSTLDEVVGFINNARRDMFPELCAQLKDDVAAWVQSGLFLVAREDGKKEEGEVVGDNNRGNVIATIGYVPYDGRFTHLEHRFRGKKTVEVVRLYVLPQWRRCGIAAALFGELKKRAEGEGVQVLYLHTHPFLPGAVGFWEKSGFRVVHVEEERVWRTTHMELAVEGGTV